jgi:hypothetical protein
MARTKVQIEIGELQDAITQLEGAKLFTSPHKLYEAVAQTPWARQLGATPVMVYLRVKEVNVDPDNPVITMKVKPARKVGPREPGDQDGNRPAKARSAKATAAGLTFDGINILMDAFRNRGIEVTAVEHLITSALNLPDENRAIMLAWADLRDTLKMPKPVKKSGPLASALENNGEIQIIVPPIAVAPIAAEPVIEAGDPVITVIEELPDGGPVQPQMEVEVEPPGETEIVIDITPEVIASDEPEGSVAQLKSLVPAASRGLVPVPAIPSPIQVAPVRPVMSRPMPVRSPLPPRPMPTT